MYRKKNVLSEHLLCKFTCALETPRFKNHCREVNRSNSNRFQVGFKLLLLLLDRRVVLYYCLLFSSSPPHKHGGVYSEVHDRRRRAPLTLIGRGANR